MTKSREKIIQPRRASEEGDRSPTFLQRQERACELARRMMQPMAQSGFLHARTDGSLARTSIRCQQ
jgi:hypothetical protein